MRRLLGIKKVLARPEPDNFIANTGRCFKCVESVVGTAHYKIKSRHQNGNYFPISLFTFCIDLLKNLKEIITCLKILVSFFIRFDKNSKIF